MEVLSRTQFLHRCALTLLVDIPLDGYWFFWTTLSELFAWRVWRGRRLILVLMNYSVSTKTPNFRSLMFVLMNYSLITRGITHTDCSSEYLRELIESIMASLLKLSPISGMAESSGVISLEDYSWMRLSIILWIDLIVQWAPQLASIDWEYNGTLDHIPPSQRDGRIVRCSCLWLTRWSIIRLSWSDCNSNDEWIVQLLAEWYSKQAN